MENAYKSEISRITGVPEHLLTGETFEENATLATALMAYKKEHSKDTSARAQFAEWLQGQQGTEKEDTSLQALNDLRNHITSYPSIRDGGECAPNMAESRSLAEQFADFVNDSLAFDPFKHNGWKKL